MTTTNNNSILSSLSTEAQAAVRAQVRAELIADLGGATATTEETPPRRRRTVLQLREN